VCWEPRHSKEYLPIDTLVVALGANDLGREVIWRTTKGPSNVGNLLGKSKIGNLEMSMSVQKQVLGLEITVDDVHAVEIVQCQCDFCSIEFGYRVGEALGRSVSRISTHSNTYIPMTYLRLSEQTEQLTTLDEIHNHVQVLGILECTPKGDQEGVLASLQHAALVIGVFHLLHLDHLLFLQDLDGVEPLVMLALDQVHTAEGAGAQGALQGKVT
jgi:hypothetical protein